MNRHGDKSGVDDLPALEFDTKIGQRLVQALKQRIGELVFLEGFAKHPYGARIGHVARQFKSEKTHEGEPVADLVLQPFVGQIVQALQNKQLEHEHAAGGLAPGGGLAFLGVDARKDGTEYLPVNHGVEPFQWVASFTQTGVAVLKVKQAGLHSRSVAGFEDL